jgi:hypothetical protein
MAAALAKSRILREFERVSGMQGHVTFGMSRASQAVLPA